MTTSLNPWRILAGLRGLRTNTTYVEIPEISDRLLDPSRFAWDRGLLKAWSDQQFRDKRKDPATGWPIDNDGRVIPPEKLYPEWRFNHQVERDGSGFTREGRNSFLCVYAKMKREGLWAEVKTVRWVGPNGEMLFTARRGDGALRAYLMSKGYGDWWMASKDFPWGVRSRFEGVQLHFRHDLAQGLFNTHLDIHNPGDTKGKAPSGWLTELPGAIRHWWYDSGGQRGSSHTYQQVVAALRRDGVIVAMVP